MSAASERVADPAPGVAVSVPVPCPLLGSTAEDAEEHGQAELHRTQDGLRAAAGAEPDAQRLLGSRHDECVVERLAPVRAVPGHALVAVEREQQLELGAVQHVVVALVEIEDREGDRRPSTTGSWPARCVARSTFPPRSRRES
jgi:hypothetical protein